MSIKMMKKAMAGAIGAMAIMGAGAAHAGIDLTQGGTLVSSASATFSGTNVVLTRTGLPSLTCNLSLDGTVVNNGSSITVTVTDGDVTGSSFLCNLVSFDFPWTATVADTELPFDTDPNTPVPATFENVSVSLCSSGAAQDVDVVFNNNGNSPSEFDFPSSSIGSNCTVDGTVYGPSGSGDINAYQN